MNSETKQFKAKWSSFTSISTVVVSALVFIFLPYVILSAVPNVYWLVLTVYLLIPALMITLIFYAPFGYRISKDAITVKRLGVDIIIPIDNIKEIRRYNCNRITGPGLRIFGVCGFFGAYGKFWNKEFGSFNTYITNNKDAVFISCKNGKKYVLSPQQPDEFVQNISHNHNFSA